MVGLGSWHSWQIGTVLFHFHHKHIDIFDHRFEVKLCDERAHTHTHSQRNLHILTETIRCYKHTMMRYNKT